jgi:putative phosphoribosyl transferase
MSHVPRFRDRSQAGKLLADVVVGEIERLRSDLAIAPKIVYALPRGGIPVAVPIARALGCPLEIIVAKKITLPGNSELAIGAVTDNGELLWSEAEISASPGVLQAALDRAKASAQAQADRFMPFCSQRDPQGAIAILVDDGIATGLTMAVAAKAMKAKQPAQIWISTPVAPAELVGWLTPEVDKVLVLATPSPFLSVSRFYQFFPQVETSAAIADLQPFLR